jgi:hypothetical protein
VDGASFSRQVFSVVFRTAAVFQPEPGESATFAGRIRAWRGYRRAQEPAQGQAGATSSALAGIEVIHLIAYSDVRGLAEAYRAGQRVLMDTSRLSLADAKRTVDFAAGLIFGTGGRIERVASQLFLLLPPARSAGFMHSRSLREQQDYGDYQECGDDLIDHDPESVIQDAPADRTGSAG